MTIPVQTSLRLIATLIVLGTSAFYLGCASSETEGNEVFGSGAPNTDDLSRAHPNTFGSDAFTLPKTRKKRPINTLIFYHKTCDLGESRDHWSKTSYDCSERF